MCCSSTYSRFFHKAGISHNSKFRVNMRRMLPGALSRGHLQSLDWTGGLTLKIIFMLLSLACMVAYLPPKWPSFCTGLIWWQAINNFGKQSIWGSSTPCCCTLPPRKLNTERGSVDEACKKKKTSNVLDWMYTWAVWCIACYYGVITAEQFTRHQTSFIVSGNISQAITYARIKPLHCWAIRPSLFYYRTTYLFHACMCREKLGCRFLHNSTGEYRSC